MIDRLTCATCTGVQWSITEVIKRRYWMAAAWDVVTVADELPWVNSFSDVVVCAQVWFETPSVLAAVVDVREPARTSTTTVIAATPITQRQWCNMNAIGL
jgi:hypothetical protein